MKTDERNFRLEYNEKSGGFHCDNYTHLADTHGWVTICDSYPDRRCIQFIEFVNKRFPVTDWMFAGRENNEKPSVKTIKSLFSEFNRIMAVQRNNIADMRQIRHERLVDMLNEYSQYNGNLKKYTELRPTSKASGYLDSNEINCAVVVFTDVLNISNGSSFDIDLYRLLQVYLLDIEKRKKINEII